MIICIDIGNTNVSFLIKRASKQELRFNLSSDRSKTEDEYFFAIAAVLNHNNINTKELCRIVICSVVPQLNFVFIRLCEKYFNTNPILLDTKHILLNINTPNPSEIGIDRLVDSYGCSIIAEKQKTKPKSCLIVDFGTATTFNFAKKTESSKSQIKWSYEGGVIFPGINLSLESLKNATAKLPRVSFVECSEILAKNTTDAINSGMFFGYKSLVEGIINEFIKIDKNVFVVATGGLSSVICSKIKSINKIQKDLTLQTILKIAEDIKT